MPKGVSNVTYGEATCDWCGVSFTKRKKWQRFCMERLTPKGKNRCRFDWHNWRKLHGEDPLPDWAHHTVSHDGGADRHDDV